MSRAGRVALLVSSTPLVRLTWIRNCNQMPGKTSSGSRRGKHHARLHQSLLANVKKSPLPRQIQTQARSQKPPYKHPLMTFLRRPCQTQNGAAELDVSIDGELPIWICTHSCHFAAVNWTLFCSVIHRYIGLHHHGWCVFSFQALDIRQCWRQSHRECTKSHDRKASLRNRRQKNGRKLGHGGLPLICSPNIFFMIPENTPLKWSASRHERSTTTPTPPPPRIAQKLQISGQENMEKCLNVIKRRRFCQKAKLGCHFCMRVRGILGDLRLIQVPLLLWLLDPWWRDRYGVPKRP